MKRLKELMLTLQGLQFGLRGQANPCLKPARANQVLFQKRLQHLNCMRKLTTGILSFAQNDQEKGEIVRR